MEMDTTAGGDPAVGPEAPPHTGDQHDHAAHDLLLATRVHKHADAWRHKALFAPRVSDPDAPTPDELPDAPSEASSDDEPANTVDMGPAVMAWENQIKLAVNNASLNASLGRTLRMLDDATRARATLSAERGAFSNAVTELQKTTEALQAENKDLQTKLDASAAETARLQHLVSELQDERDAATAVAAAAAASAPVHATDNTATEAEVAAMRAERDAAAEEAAVARRAVAELQEQRDASVAAAAAIETAARANEEEKTRCHMEEIRALQQLIDELRETSAAAAVDVRETAAAAAAAAAEVRSASVYSMRRDEHEDELRDAEERHKRELDEVHAKLATAERRIRLLEHSRSTASMSPPMPSLDQVLQRYPDNPIRQFVVVYPHNPTNPKRLTVGHDVLAELPLREGSVFAVEGEVRADGFYVATSRSGKRGLVSAAHVEPVDLSHERSRVDVMALMHAPGAAPIKTYRANRRS